MNIDKMEAGREMDAAIAERVMGWTEGVIDTDTAYGPVRCWLDENDEYAATIDYWEHSGTHNEPWKPSIDIAAAWQVVDRFEHITIGRDWDWEVHIWTVDPEARHEAIADTVPLAICRAAYKAKSNRD